MDYQHVQEMLADIDRHVELVAQRNRPGTDLSELAYAIHNLTHVVVDLARSSLEGT